MKSVRRQRGQWTSALAFALILLANASARPAPDTQDGCSRTVVARAPSPEGTASATVVESICGAGGYAQDVTAEVRVGTTPILGVDTGGHAEDRPRLAWSAPHVLDVTVRNLSFLHVLTFVAGPVAIRLHFDPPDPPARAAWLRAHDLPADKLPSSPQP